MKISVVKEESSALKQIAERGKMACKEAALANLLLWKTRIFEQGKDANNANIGNYSKGYMRTRAKNNRDSSTKVILVLTGNLETDMSIIPYERGYSVGTNNAFNFQKARWCEERYKRKIFSLSKNERAIISKVISDVIR